MDVPLQMVIKTIVAQQEGLYSSFPTFTVHKGQVHIYYRQGVRNDYQCHGLKGVTRRFTIDVRSLLCAFEDKETLSASGRDIVLFESENELDAIVSRPDDKVFTLCTRIYVKDKIGRTFISVSDTPFFQDRQEVHVPGVEWLVFYGKAFVFRGRYVFPAYGVLEGQEVCRPLVCATTGFKSWELLSCLCGGPPGVVFNEHSIIEENKGFTMFIREDSPPYGIWESRSRDLAGWSTPVKIIDSAHAPTALMVEGEVYLSYRDLSRPDCTSVAVVRPRRERHARVIATYRGNLYDGGYTDMGCMGGHLFIVYYIGNEEGEPLIEMARLCRCSHTKLHSEV